MNELLTLLVIAACYAAQRLILKKPPQQAALGTGLLTVVIACFILHFGLGLLLVGVYLAWANSDELPPKI